MSGSAASWRQANDKTAFQHEMFAPDIVARMKQCNDRTHIGINTRQVRSFVRVATITGEREVLRIISSTVLLRHNVLDMKRNQWRRFLRDAAIFASIAGAPSDELSRARIHFSCGLLCQEPSSFSLYD